MSESETCVARNLTVHQTNYFSIADSIFKTDDEYWNDRLVEICSTGDTRGVSALVNKLKQNGELSLDCFHSKSGETGLIAACRNAHYETVELLLRLGADPTVRNYSGESTLDFCTVDTHLRSIIMGAHRHITNSKTNLLVSAWTGNSTLFSENLPALNDDVSIADLCNANDIPLFVLAVENIELMVEVIKDDNVSNSYRPGEIVDKLVTSGINVNKPDPTTGRTALHYLAKIDSTVAVGMMRQIIENSDADLSIRDLHDNMPLHYACGIGNEGAALLLLHDRTDEVNAKGEGGQTPLHFTASAGCQNLVHTLLQCGADVTIIDDRGFTPVDLAKDGVVQASLREAWAEATTRRRRKSSTDTESDRLAKSECCTVQPFGGKLRMIRSLPVLPSISPSGYKSGNSPEEKPFSVLANSSLLHPNKNEHVLQGLDNALSPRRVLSKNSLKPRLRRWRSTSAGSSAGFGVRLPPLYKASFEVGLNGEHKLQLRAQTTSDNESEAVPSLVLPNDHWSVNDSARTKTKTLQTTMPCRVSLMILGARPPNIANDMSVESVSARSTTTPVNNSIAEKAEAATKALTCKAVVQVIKGQPVNNGGAKRPEKGRKSVDNRTKVPSKPVTLAQKLAVLRPRRQSMSPERVVTTRPTPLKEIAPLYSKNDFPMPMNLVDNILQPSLKIEQICVPNDNSSLASDDDGKSCSSCSVKKAKTPVRITKSSNSQRDKKKKLNPKASKDDKRMKMPKSKPSSASGSLPTVAQANAAKLENDNMRPPMMSYVLENGVSLRLPIDGQPQEDGIELDCNSLKALSDIVQLSTVAEEDEVMASIRSSLARMTPAQLSQLPPDLQKSLSAAAAVLDGDGNDDDDDDDEVNNDGDDEDDRTITPNDIDDMERELMQLGQADGRQSDVLQSLVDDDQANFDGNRRSDSRVSSTRNPVVFQEDVSLPEVEMNDPGSINSQHSGLGVKEAAGLSKNQQHQSLEHASKASRTVFLSQSPHEDDNSRPPSRDSNYEPQQSIRWRKGNEIGHGGYGKVFLALTSLGGLIAVKQIDTSRYSRDAIEKEYERIDEEINILRTLKHPSIVEFYGTSFESDVVNIFMEFIAGGSIASILRRFGNLEENVFRRYTRQLLKAVAYLHSNGIVHRDIKGANVMVTGEGLIKLIDFGCARRLVESAACGSSFGHDQAHTGAQLISAKGTPYWMAPEVICETGHGRKSDIWSIGCTVFEMATRRPPWADLEPSAAMFAIASGRKPVPPLPTTFSSNACNFVAACLSRQPAARPTAAELIDHPWFHSSAHRPPSNTKHQQQRRRSAVNEHNSNF